jgi:hypothetical protein
MRTGPPPPAGRTARTKEASCGHKGRRRIQTSTELSFFTSDDSDP